MAAEATAVQPIDARFLTHPLDVVLNRPRRLPQPCDRDALDSITSIGVGNA